jgi:hypothetical protein
MSGNADTPSESSSSFAFQNYRIKAGFFHTIRITIGDPSFFHAFINPMMRCPSKDNSPFSSQRPLIFPSG